MRAAIVNPYLDTLGGGERYTVSFAKYLSEIGWDVDIEWKNESLKEEIEKRFGFSLQSVNFIPSVKRGERYDLCFWVSDGSIPTLLARKNILHFQVPFHDVGGRSLLNKMKLFRINKIIVNSLFTKKVIDREFGVQSIVVYPPVDTGRFKQKKKDNIILSVGRFSDLLQNKKQDLLINTFRKMCDEGLKDYKLVLAGGSEVGADVFLRKLKNLASGYPVEVVESPKFDDLKELYERSKIFWSASGFGVQENLEPEKVEHFGMVVVEAMASGIVPLVYNAGGHKEIVSSGHNGFLWESPEELIRVTSNVINDKNLQKELAKKAKSSSQKFSIERFNEACGILIK